MFLRTIKKQFFDELYIIRLEQMRRDYELEIYQLKSRLLVKDNEIEHLKLLADVNRNSSGK